MGDMWSAETLAEEHAEQAHKDGYAEGEEKTLKKIYDGLAKSGLDPADYMAVIRLIGRIMADE